VLFNRIFISEHLLVFPFYKRILGKVAVKKKRKKTSHTHMHKQLMKEMKSGFFLLEEFYSPVSIMGRLLKGMWALLKYLLGNSPCSPVGWYAIKRLQLSIKKEPNISGKIFCYNVSFKSAVSETKLD